MIPEGLVILTSIALASANVKLAKQNVLVQQLYCIENLARVDVLCLDKTGTITTGRMRVKELIAQNDYTKEQIEQTLADLMGSLPDVNASAKAMRNYIKHVKPVQKAKVLFTFNSKNKYSGAGFEGENCYIGAYSFLFSSPDPLVEEQIAKISRSGERVLVLAKGKAAAGADLKDLQLMGLIVLEDELRPDAAEILDYFQKQDVQIKVISGDMLETVEAVASKAGVKGKGISMQNVPDESLCEIMDEYSVFGRVLPAQKMEMVKALEKNGHTVAMVGDGVNDVMALKQADCSIAMGSGSQAARSVASMVLLEDQFAALPEILVEGRRVINNIQRTASLFLVKTLFSFGLCLLSIFWISIYPFVPIQLTMVSALTTGIPAFILTFEPSSARVQGSFLVNVLSKAVPGAISLCFGISMMWICISFGFLAGEDALFQTLCTILAAINGWFVLSSVCRPFTRLRLILLTLSAVSLGVCIVLLPSAFSLVQIGWDAFFYLVITAGLQTALLHILMQANWGRMLEKLSFLQTEKEKIKNIVNTSYR
jgi:cation-transporting ATPase E